MKIKDGQTLADVAVQQYGTWEAMADIALANGLSMSDIPEAGTDLSLPDKTYNTTMQLYCKNNNVSPATARDNSGVHLRIFGDEFTQEFD